MRRSSLLIVVAMVCVSLLTTGCFTRTSRDYGYIDTGTPSVQTYYQPVTPVQPQVAQPMTVTPVQPQGLVALPSPTYTNQNGRITYEHNHEEFNPTDVLGAGFLGLGIVNSILHWDHVARHPHRNYRRHWRW